MKKEDAGYTVLEALCAFAILATGLAALYAGASTSLRGLEHIAKTREATLFAQSKLDEIAVDRRPLAAMTSGKFPGSNVSWTIFAKDISPQRDAPARLVLQNVHLIVNWPADAGVQRLSIDTNHLGTPDQ